MGIHARHKRESPVPVKVRHDSRPYFGLSLVKESYLPRKNAAVVGYYKIPSKQRPRITGSTVPSQDAVILPHLPLIVRA